MSVLTAPRGYVVVHCHPEGEPCVIGGHDALRCRVRPGLLTRVKRWWQS